MGIFLKPYGRYGLLVNREKNKSCFYFVSLLLWPIRWMQLIF
jgi:hypothetical protein